MLKKDIIGLGVLIPRTNSTPQIVYLLPQVSCLFLTFVKVSVPD